MIPALRDNVTVVRHPWSPLSPSVVGVSLRRPQSSSSRQVAKVSMDVLSMKMSLSAPASTSASGSAEFERECDLE